MTSRFAAIAALAALAMATPARAGLPAGAQSGVDEAFGKLDDKAGRARVIGTLPRWFVPEDRALLARMWDAGAVLGPGPFTAQDMPTLINIREKENVLLRSYLTFTGKPTEEVNQQRNTVEFQDEIARGEAFAARLSAAMLTALADLAGHMKPEQMTDDRKDGLKQLRKDIVEQAEAAALALRNPALSNDNRKLIVDALVDSATPIALAISRYDRESFAVIAIAAQPSLAPSDKDRMREFADAMDRDDCKGLCDLN